MLSELSLSDDDDLDDLEADDRERLANMTELEREMEVALKEERLQQKRQRAQLLRKEKKREKEAKDIAEGRQTGTERRTQDAKKAALEQLAAKKRKQTGGKKKANRSDARDDEEEYEDEDEAYEKEEEEEEGYEEDYYARGLDDEDDMDIDADPEPASYLEAKTIQMRRHKMEEWVDKPFFQSTMNGVVVRLAMGIKKVGVIMIGDDERWWRGHCRRRHCHCRRPSCCCCCCCSSIPSPRPRSLGKPKPNNPHNNIHQTLPGEMTDRDAMSYVCAKVIGVAEREPGYYKFHSSQPWKSPYPFGKGKTSLWLRVMRGGSEKFWPLAQVSNSSITEQEWFHYQNGESQAADKGARELTRGDVERARKRLLEAENYTYSEKDVADLLRNKKTVVRNAALEKARLERERDAAVQRGDEAMAANCDEEIRKLERAGAKRKKEDKMALVNAKNAKKNFQDGLAFKEDITGGDQGGAEMDPFRRRVTRPMIYWKTKREDQQGGEGADGADGAGGEANGAGGEEEQVVDVREAIRGLLGGARGSGTGASGCGGLYNPNSNTTRRMLSRKFMTSDRGGGGRVYTSVDAFERDSRGY